MERCRGIVVMRNLRKSAGVLVAAKHPQPNPKHRRSHSMLRANSTIPHQSSARPADAGSYSFGGQEVRVVIRDGEPWFVAADVCAALGIRNSRDAVEPLDDDEKGVGSTDTLGGKQRLSLVSEGGLYTIILRCRAATTRGTIAHRFRRWVTGELLPAIRKNLYGPIPTAAPPADPARIIPVRAHARRAPLAGQAIVTADSDSLYPFIERGDELLVDLRPTPSFGPVRRHAIVLALHPATRQPIPIWLVHDPAQRMVYSRSPTETASATFREGDFGNWHIIGVITGVNKRRA